MCVFFAVCVCACVCVYVCVSAAAANDVAVVLSLCTQNVMHMGITHTHTHTDTHTHTQTHTDTHTHILQAREAERSFKRANKHRPHEASSKRPVPRLREIIQPAQRWVRVDWFVRVCVCVG